MQFGFKSSQYFIWNTLKDLEGWAYLAYTIEGRARGDMIQVWKYLHGKYDVDSSLFTVDTRGVIRSMLLSETS